jgi:GNAT superfamily N-acetyltransferase
VHLLEEIAALGRAEVAIVCHPYYHAFTAWARAVLSQDGHDTYHRAARLPAAAWPPAAPAVSFITQRGPYADITSVLNGAGYLRSREDLYVAFADNLYCGHNPLLALQAAPPGIPTVLARPYQPELAARRGVIAARRSGEQLLVLDLAGRGRHRPGPPGGRPAQLRHAVPVGADLVGVRRGGGAGGDRGARLLRFRAGEVLSRVIADAFHDLAVSRWLIPDGAARRAIFPGYFRILVEHAMAGGLVCTTPQRTAAALWLPASGPAAPPDGYTGQLAEATGPFLDRFLAFDEELARHHLAGVLHHHLAILAVRPDQHGQGIGTALLQAHHATFDWQGIAAYLEASDERTRGLYQRRGYTDHGTPIRLPGGPDMYPMVRRPPRVTGGRRWHGAANSVSPAGLDRD